LSRASFIGSTSALLKYVQSSPKREFIVATEVGILHQMEKHSPGKIYYPAPPDANCACNECPHMKRNTMEKLYLCMKNRTPEITMDEELRLRALKPIQRMLEMS
jgi:quinolinate synthase